MAALSRLKINLLVLTSCVLLQTLLYSETTNADELIDSSQVLKDNQPLKNTQGTNKQVFYGSFSQSKSIKPLKRPFNSSGNFIYKVNSGILWHTRKPVESVSKFAEDGVYKLDEKGKLQKEAPIDNEFFLALFSADEAKLAQFFTSKPLPKAALAISESTEPAVAETKNTITKETSCLALSPLSSAMQSLFSQVHLCVAEVAQGVKVPSRIKLFEANGNSTDIQLTLLNTPVPVKELAYFD